MVKKRFLNYVACFVAGGGLVGWVLTSADDSANEAALAASAAAVPARCVAALAAADAVVSLAAEREGLAGERLALHHKRLTAATSVYRSSRDVCKAAQR